ncbi:LysR substrate-binding domain-containing protein [Achromobacter aloeverae]|uniref:XRE family transcriptional regulator n=1 Tax=Achromobacter aloeverae TaxID=1750518 RepID=A0A4Q1HI30_9BURK|nr:LysR substrate-binding domain-containing protein [Achromobacter aloeverae]RXN86247.1 XRE family transcriptional regulator [Achromobacter aloeverae]
MQTPPRSFPSFASLRAFEAVARLGQVARAAEELNLTPSAISHRLKDLERHLGISLFNGSRNGITLTDAGRGIAVNLSGLLNSLDTVLRSAAPSLPRHKLTVSVHPSFGSRWLAPRLGLFCEAHPDLLLDLRLTQALTHFSMDDGVDAAIRYGAGGWPGLHTTPLLQDRLILACSPAFAGGAIPRSPADLAGLRLIRDSHDSPRDWFEHFDLAFPAMREIVADDPSFVAMAVINRAGVGLVRETLVSDALEAGTIIALFDMALPTRYGYFFVCPLARHAEPKIATLRAWLSDAVT